MEARMGLFPSPHNLSTLRHTTLQSYCNALLPFPRILKKLQNNNWFISVTPIDYSMDDFLQSAILADCLDVSAVQLLTQPLLRDTESKVVTLDHLPIEFADIHPQLSFYIQLLGDVLNNELGKQNYESGLPDRENVSEKVHALQAGKMAALLLAEDKILPLLLHDIARPTCKDPVHGHANHCREGSTILAPLGLSIDYTLYHAFAKYLLNQFCPPYKENLISPVSQASLEIQQHSLQPLIDTLNHLNSTELAAFLYTIMFMRLIDDFSKVPHYELKKTLAGKKVDYFTDDDILQMLEKQAVLFLKNVDAVEEDKVGMLEQYNTKLDAAITLLLRAKQYTNNAALYEKFSIPHL